jgi:hypothetical protein
MTTDDHINDILKNVRKNIKPSSGPLTSIDPKKLAKASKDVQIAKEVAELVEKNHTEDKKSDQEDK